MISIEGEHADLFTGDRFFVYKNDTAFKVCGFLQECRPCPDCAQVQDKLKELDVSRQEPLLKKPRYSFSFTAKEMSPATPAPETTISFMQPAKAEPLTLSGRKNMGDYASTAMERFSSPVYLLKAEQDTGYMICPTVNYDEYACLPCINCDAAAKGFTALGVN